MAERRIAISEQEAYDVCNGPAILMRKMRKQPGQDLLVWDKATSGWEDGDGCRMKMPYNTGEVLLVRGVQGRGENRPWHIVVQQINPKLSKGGWFWRIEVKRAEEVSHG